MLVAHAARVPIPVPDLRVRGGQDVEPETQESTCLFSYQPDPATSVTTIRLHVRTAGDRKRSYEVPWDRPMKEFFDTVRRDLQLPTNVPLLLKNADGRLMNELLAPAHNGLENDDIVDAHIGH